MLSVQLLLLRDLNALPIVFKSQECFLECNAFNLSLELTNI